MPDISAEAQEWILYAKRDLDSADFLLNMKPQPFEIICYHCQQSAEKMLKAFLIQNNCKIEKTHDLKMLANTCSTINQEFQKILPECSRLTPYGIQARYPFSIEIEENDMKIALDDAKTILNFVEAKFD